jgi:predicted phosphodiesterase
MVKISILSDLHLEFLDKIPDINTKADILILAGDIGYIDKPLFREFICDVSTKYNNKHIIYVFGNHEFYVYNDDETMDSLKKRYIEYFNEFDNIHLLDNDSFVYGDYIFVGSTLWSKIPFSKKKIAEKVLNDFKMINITPQQKITVDHYNTLHNECVSYLVNTIFKSRDKKIIVVTHHAPYINTPAGNVSNPIYNNNGLSCLYSTDLSHIFYPNIVWIFGHTHWSCDFSVKNIRLISNQCGYSGEDIPFNVNLVIDL